MVSNMFVYMYTFIFNIHRISVKYIFILMFIEYFLTVLSTLTCEFYVNNSRPPPLPEDTAVLSSNRPLPWRLWTQGVEFWVRPKVLCLQVLSRVPGSFMAPQKTPDLDRDWDHGFLSFRSYYAGGRVLVDKFLPPKLGSLPTWSRWKRYEAGNDFSGILLVYGP